MKESGTFYIQRKENITVKKRATDVLFFATLGQNDEMDKKISQLSGLDKGTCKDISVDPAYRKCGIPSRLVAKCFQDSRVLGDDGKGYLSILMNTTWPEEQLRKDAISRCKSMIMHSCNGRSSCSVYLKGAKLSGYDIVFFQRIPKNKRKSDQPEDKGKVTKILNLEDDIVRKYEKDPKRFTAQIGENWYFCKCKDGENNEKEKCLSMTTGNSFGPNVSKPSKIN